MTEKLQIYKCSVCRNIVEVLHAASGQLVCCGKPMEKLEEKTTDKGSEKHVPVIEKTPNSIKAKVGSVPHPMEKEHFIELIEILADDKIYRQFLKPGQAPEATFKTATGNITARELCNIHGLWKGQLA